MLALALHGTNATLAIVLLYVRTRLMLVSYRTLLALNALYAIMLLYVSTHLLLVCYSTTRALALARAACYSGFC